MTPQNGKTQQVVATGLIWGFATGMLALCIPLVSLTQGSLILPLGVITGAIVGTVAIWRQGSRSSTGDSNPSKNLEERVANLEVILGKDEVDLQNRLKQLEPSDRQPS
ncbi:hypothetical protein H6F88_21305 [Oculatella sp. FACHB-28]|uniref:hypothetical protein n=1 Tax=Cyanophyceae TaxID=3028117 RepID=UPI0016848367|nr:MULTISPECIES: hypothetical protein [Cyanophyceae]MBD1870758.1 hypothetical protein [Cyanobacteria bacterium FACHB-471]MBD1998642.1 hypothetical protein [Leptolyngbya sp. FACHB-541]MBD2058501.1 hypothetical protein [Oculatella sp. FACHB-28]MBD2071765.1 hypothetical protein [Leptolyngbya sp. FACHB-671]